MAGVIRVELAGPEQAELVLRVATESFQEYRDTLIPPPGILAESVADVAAYIARGGAVLAWIGDTPVGCARFHAEADHLYIGRVAVPPQFRRQGVASAMMRFLEGHARELGFNEAQVEVRQALPGNIALYGALGYEAISVQPHPRVPSALTVRMAKRL
jgi:ribosomal protein S18 acetylase RimI-like enzyme